MSGAAAAGLPAPLVARGRALVRLAVRSAPAHRARRRRLIDPLAAQRPRRIGESYRWPDGTWTHPG